MYRKILTFILISILFSTGNDNTNDIHKDSECISFDESWEYADFSEIHTSDVTLYYATENRKDIVVGVNAGHGTKGGSLKKTYSHPDKSPKLTGGTNPAGAIKSIAVSSGMIMEDGTPEAEVNLLEAQILKEKLLERGYDVLMIRDSDDVQLDNIARTVYCNNNADCHIAIHWDKDSCGYDKGCFYISVPDKLKSMEPVASVWEQSEKLGESLIKGLQEKECKIFKNGSMDIDLTQTSFSKIPSVDIELGNSYSKHDEKTLELQAEGIALGIDQYFINF